MKPFPGLIGAVGGQRWELDVERAAGGGLNRGGAVPVGWGGGGGVGELPRGEVKPFGGSVVVEEGCGAPATAS